MAKKTLDERLDAQDADHHWLAKGQVDLRQRLQAKDEAAVRRSARLERAMEDLAARMAVMQARDSRARWIAFGVAAFLAALYYMGG